MFRHEILGGLVKIYRREGTRHWHCAASLKGERHRATTKEEGLPEAQQFAEDWYLELRGKSRAGLLKKSEKTFAQAAEQFLKEYETITEGQRSPVWVEGHGARLRLHLLPFLGKLGLSEVTPGKVQEYRVHRMTAPPAANSEAPERLIANGAKRAYARPWKAPSRSTLHDEIVTMRQVLKTAIRHGWLAHLHDFSPPYRSSGKVVHRPWFSPAEYKQLYAATRQYARDMQGKRHQWNAEQVHARRGRPTFLRRDRALSKRLSRSAVRLARYRKMCRPIFHWRFAMDPRNRPRKQYGDIRWPSYGRAVPDNSQERCVLHTTARDRHNRRARPCHSAAISSVDMSGNSLHSRPSSSRPPDFGRRPPHCLKKNATPFSSH